MAALFLQPSDIKTLTGCAHKDKQIAQLRKMGLPFFVNAGGRPVVTAAVVEGAKQPSTPQAWQPAVLQGGRKSA